MALIYLRRLSLLWLVANLLCVGCSSGIVGTLPQPSNSPAPPSVLGRGTLAVISRDGPRQRVLIFPPNSDRFTKEIPIRDEHGQHLEGNSLAFDRRGHLYIGMHDTSPDGKYLILEVDIHNWKAVRTIVLPGSSHSRVATDDQSYLYVNSTAFGTGVIDIFKNNLETKPHLQIKVNLHNPRTIFVGRDALWVGYTGLLSPVLARFRLRSTDRTLFEPIPGRADAMTVNREESSVAVLTDQNNPNAKDFVDVFDVQSKRTRKLLRADRLSTLTSDESGQVFMGEQRDARGEWSIAVTTFDHKFILRITSSDTRSNALAISPLDGTLYVAFKNKSNVDVYNPQNGKVLKHLRVGFDPSVLAFEP